MRPTAQLHEVKAMKFLDVWGRFDSKRLTTIQAAELLGVSISTFYRMRKKYDENGEDGLLDLRVGKPSPKRIAVDTQMKICSLYKSTYTGWTVKHFHEKLSAHGFKISYSSTKNILQSQGIVPKAAKRGKHRRKREPSPMAGMMLHQDGSTHEWTPGKYWDLIVTMDDATNEIYSMFFCEEEGTFSSFQGMSETIKKCGLPCSLYTDRGSHYFITPEAGGKVDKAELTQFGRAMKQLGIEHIPAYSPQARGRSERMFKTLQSRLPHELSLHGIANMEEANDFIRNIYLPEHNARFSHAPESLESAFCPLNGVNIDDIMCIQESRIVRNDNTISYKSAIIQLDADEYRHHYVRNKVCVHEYPDGSLKVFHGPRMLKAMTVKTKKEEDYSDGFIASQPKLNKKAREAHTSPCSNFGCASSARVAPQRCPIL